MPSSSARVVKLWPAWENTHRVMYLRRKLSDGEGVHRELRKSPSVSVQIRAGKYNLPLSSKIVTQVLEPIDITAQFGKKPDVADVDAYVRKVMQSALTDLAAQRRFPVLG